jgi:biopolymer transport protein ExbD
MYTIFGNFPGFLELGAWTTHHIRPLFDLFRDPDVAPALASTIFGSALVLCVLFIIDSSFIRVQVRRRIRAVKSIKGKVEFAEAMPNIERLMLGTRYLRHSWQKFRETLIEPSGEEGRGPKVVLNTARLFQHSRSGIALPALSSNAKLVSWHRFIAHIFWTRTDHAADEESYFISMTDVFIGLLFIFIIMLMFFAMRFQEATQKQKEETQKQEVVTQKQDEVTQKQNALIENLTDSEATRVEVLQNIGSFLQSRGLNVTIIRDEGILRLPEEMLFAKANWERLALVVMGPCVRRDDRESYCFLRRSRAAGAATSAISASAASSRQRRISTASTG